MGRAQGGTLPAAKARPEPAAGAGGGARPGRRHTVARMAGPQGLTGRAAAVQARRSAITIPLGAGGAP